MATIPIEIKTAPTPAGYYWLTGLLFLPTGALLLSWASFVLGVPCTFAGTLLAAALLIASVTDIHHRKIPNWLTYSMLLWGLLLNGYATAFAYPASGVLSREHGLGAVGLPDSLVGAAACFAVMLVGYLASGTGAGDVKLLTAVGAVAGVADGLSTLLWGYIAAGMAILLWQILCGNALQLVIALCRNIASHFAPQWISPPPAEQRSLLQRPFPLAAAFAVGALVAYFGDAMDWRALSR
jgi:prepilin peptidase CpaA